MALKKTLCKVAIIINSCLPAALYLPTNTAAPKVTNINIVVQRCCVVETAEETIFECMEISRSDEEEENLLEIAENRLIGPQKFK